MPTWWAKHNFLLDATHLKKKVYKNIALVAAIFVPMILCLRSKSQSNTCQTCKDWKEGRLQKKIPERRWKQNSTLCILLPKRNCCSWNIRHFPMDSYYSSAEVITSCIVNEFEKWFFHLFVLRLSWKQLLFQFAILYLTFLDVFFMWLTREIRDYCQWLW